LEPLFFWFFNPLTTQFNSYQLNKALEQGNHPWYIKVFYFVQFELVHILPPFGFRSFQCLDMLDISKNQGLCLAAETSVPTAESAPMTINKKSLSERDICSKFITPALVSAGWDLQTQVRKDFRLLMVKSSSKGKP